MQRTMRMRSLIAFAALPLAIAGSACAVGTSNDTGSPADDGDAGGPAPMTTDKADGGPNLSGHDANVQHPGQDAGGHDSAVTPDVPDAKPSPPDAAPDTGPTTCSGYADTTTAAGCHCKTGHTCTANGCYGGYYCDLALTRCVSKPASCP